MRERSKHSEVERDNLRHSIGARTSIGIDSMISFVISSWSSGDLA